MQDLVIRGGKVVDGTGAPPRFADIAVQDGVITHVGPGAPRGKREVDASDLVVTPGFVDVHTHYDGQVTWDPYLTPSSWHGVTTAVFGNCGVGFAPVRKESIPGIINVMQGVEDIPEVVLTEGVKFDWESFPQYMDSIAAAPHVMDVGTQVPHAALRYYVMGERGMDHRSEPSRDEIQRMSSLLEEALGQGALGFTTSRTFRHQTADGRSVPSLSAGASEWGGIVDAMKRANRGVIEVNSDMGPGEFEFMERVGRESGRPLSFLLVQATSSPDLWRETMGKIHGARSRGVQANAQAGCRAIGVLMGLETTMNPFAQHPAWSRLESLSPRERYERLRSDEELRRELVSEPPNAAPSRILDRLPEAYVLDGELDYEPDPSRSLTALAAASGRSVRAIALEAMMGMDGQGMLLLPHENYAHGSLDTVHEMLVDDATMIGLSDAGAHVGVICDASAPTLLITHWTRDRKRGPRLPLEFAVHKQTQATAWYYGLRDRGVIAPGYKADLNVIDYEGLRLHYPAVQYDLPAGGRRLAQRASGYVHTFVSGVETVAGDAFTGELPGRLVRGAREHA